MTDLLRRLEDIPNPENYYHALKGIGTIACTLLSLSLSHSRVHVVRLRTIVHSFLLAIERIDYRPIDLQAS